MQLRLPHALAGGAAAGRRSSSSARAALAAGSRRSAAAASGLSFGASSWCSSSSGGSSSRRTPPRVVAAAAASSEAWWQPGELVQGVVESFAPFGVFVRLDSSQVGLLHISQISGERLHDDDLDAVFREGETITALVLRADPDTRRIALSTKALEKQRGDMLNARDDLYAGAEAAAAAWREARATNAANRAAARQEFATWKVGQLVEGVVEKLVPYGAFVRVGEPGGTALLHISEVSGERINQMEDVFEVGERVKALVLKVDLDKGRVSLSTKKLEADSGDMLRDRAGVWRTAEAAATAFQRSMNDEY